MISLAGNAYLPSALAQIFAIKERPTFDPLIVHICEISQLADIAENIPDAAYALAKAYWPGPMTMILPKKECIPDLCTSGLPSVAVRFPSHPVAQEIIWKAGVPLAAPSANLFKHVSPTTAEHVAAPAQLADRGLAGIVDGGPCNVGVESTIVSLVGEPTVLRPGAITPEMIAKVIGDVKVKESTSKPGQAMAAPGQCDTHYRPQVPLFYGEIPEGFELPKSCVRIAFGNRPGVIPATLDGKAVRLYARPGRSQVRHDPCGSDSECRRRYGLERPPEKGEYQAIRLKRLNLFHLDFHFEDLATGVVFNLHIGGAHLVGAENGDFLAFAGLSQKVNL